MKHEPCPYCGAQDHGAVTQPTVTCTRHLWDIIGALRVERGTLRWAMEEITTAHDGPLNDIAFRAHADHIARAGLESVTIDAINEAKGDAS